MKRVFLAVIALFSGFGSASAATGGHGCGGVCPVCLPPPPPKTLADKKKQEKDGE